MLKILLAAVPSVVLLTGASAFAGPASDAVRFFYGPPVVYPPDPEFRDRFVAPAAAEFAANDTVSEEGETCFDWSLAIDAQDVDEDTLSKTLKLTEAVSGDTAEVTATFDLFPDAAASEPRKVLWNLKKVSGAWKVSDIASETGAWRLSELGCGQ